MQNINLERTIVDLLNLDTEKTESSLVLFHTHDNEPNFKLRRLIQ
jgi:hypothetical protein